MKALLAGEIEPDVEELISIIRRERKPGRVHFIELFIDEELKSIICEYFELTEGLNRADPLFLLHRDIKLHEFLGYDVFRVDVIGKELFTIPLLRTEDTTLERGQQRKEREWTEEHRGPIQSWEDFENYPWPDVSGIDLRLLEWLEKNLPENMGCYDLTAHILEMITFLFGYETFCYKIFDEPDLVDAVARKVGEFYVDYTQMLCDFDCIPLVWGSDDMGFRSGTLVSPSFLKEKVLPWHRRCAEVAHEKNKPYLLHVCGNIEAIMDDLIDYVGIDAKHSFEDAIMPVTEAYERYGNRIAILGGIDVDFLCRADERSIRKRVRDTLDICMKGSGYCLGTGNTVANYVPLKNYLAMLDEGRMYKV